MCLRGFVLLVMLIGSLSPLCAQDALKVVNWNLEWFADGSTHDPAVQTEGVGHLMQAINADVYALCEVVNIDSLESAVAGLPDSFGWYVSSFATFAASPVDPDYAGAQKLGFVYRKSRVRNVSHGPLLKGSTGSAYTWFSSGRYPWRVRCEVKSPEGSWEPMVFVVLHAKAYADDQSCYRRTMGANELRDTLNTYFPAARFLVLGDFNDDLDVSNCGGASNYLSIVQDVANFDCLTLPISQAGAYSSEGYTSLIDHAVASNELGAWYVPGSATVLKNLVLSYYPDYAYDISDHYPVMTKFIVAGSAPAGIGGVSESGQRLNVWPQPAGNELWVALPPGAPYRLLSMAGQPLCTGTTEGIVAGISLRDVPPGIYLLEARCGSDVLRRKIVVQR